MVLLPEQIAVRVRELREILELTPGEVAERIDVDTETYEKYEAAETDIPIGKLYLIDRSVHRLFQCRRHDSDAARMGV